MSIPSEISYVGALILFAGYLLTMFLKGYNHVKKELKERYDETISGSENNDTLTFGRFLELRKKLDAYEAYESDVLLSLKWTVRGTIGGVVASFLGIVAPFLRPDLFSVLSQVALIFVAVSGGVFFVYLIQLAYRMLPRPKIG